MFLILLLFMRMWCDIKLSVFKKFFIVRFVFFVYIVWNILELVKGFWVVKIIFKIDLILLICFFVNNLLYSYRYRLDSVFGMFWVLFKVKNLSIILFNNFFK